MRPHTISHILITIPGQVNPAEQTNAAACDEYELIRRYFGGDAWLTGPAGMRSYSDKCQPFSDTDYTPAGCQPVFVARRAESYVISADPRGLLGWNAGEIGEDHLICLLSQRVPHVIAGQEQIDLETAFGELSTYFGIHTLLLRGESPIGRSAMQAGLVDEVSMLIAPSVSQGSDTPVESDEMASVGGRLVPLKLKFVDRRNHDVLWVRYDVIRDSGEACSVTKN